MNSVHVGPQQAYTLSLFLLRCRMYTP